VGVHQIGRTWGLCAPTSSASLKVDLEVMGHRVRAREASPERGGERAASALAPRQKRRVRIRDLIQQYIRPSRHHMDDNVVHTSFALHLGKRHRHQPNQGGQSLATLLMRFLELA
jgi:hypothetical protein